MKRKYYALIIIVILLGAMYLLPNQPQQNIQVINKLSFQSNKTYLFVSGVSPFDPYDRVVSIYYSGVEIARIITPLHRDGSLPNSFGFLLNFTFPILSSQLYYSILRVQNTWTVNFNVLHLSTSNQNVVNILIPTVMNVSSGMKLDFNVPVSGTLYLLISLHDKLEGQAGTVMIDNVSYPIFNWHPINELQLTTIGVVIPPIVMNVSQGYHTLIINAPSGSYMYISAYEVY